MNGKRIGDFGLQIADSKWMTNPQSEIGNRTSHH
jgi:hypothetical protein